MYVICSISIKTLYADLQYLCILSSTHTSIHYKPNTEHPLYMVYYSKSYIYVNIRIRMHSTLSATGRLCQTYEKGKAEVEIEIVDKINLCDYFHNNLIFKLLL
jgi:hypothetical protein